MATFSQTADSLTEGMHMCVGSNPKMPLLQQAGSDCIRYQQCRTACSAQAHEVLRMQGDPLLRKAMPEVTLEAPQARVCSPEKREESKG
eukprot:scaffold468377_cov50-Prasinocladus_malaysianus.AAC.2